MIYTPAYINRFDGLMAHHYTGSSLSSNLSIKPETASSLAEDISLLPRISRFTFSLYMSLTSVSTGLSFSLRKMKITAKFNKEAYAESIKESLDMPEQGETPLSQPLSIKLADYSFHIKETSGKVLSCSETWYK
jgi:hypothetical protein